MPMVAGPICLQSRVAGIPFAAGEDMESPALATEKKGTAMRRLIPNRWPAATLAVAALSLLLPTTMAAENPSSNQLKDKRVAILVAEGFEQPELVEPRKALDQ